MKIYCLHHKQEKATEFPAEDALWVLQEAHKAFKRTALVVEWTGPNAIIKTAPGAVVPRWLNFE